MNPSVELRLRSMMRALSEVILPGIDAHNSLAQEQARLLLGHLHALLLQDGREGALHDLESTALRQLAVNLLEVCAGGAVTGEARDAVSAALQHDDCSALSVAVEDLVIAAGIDGSAEFVAQSAALVREHARTQIRRGRSWFKAMGFDSAPESLPAIDTLFNEDMP